MEEHIVCHFVLPICLTLVPIITSKLLIGFK